MKREFKGTPEEVEEFKEKVISLYESGKTHREVAEELGLSVGKRSTGKGHCCPEIEHLRKQDYEFARRVRDAIWGRPEDGPFIRQRYGVTIDHAHLNRFLVEYSSHGSRSRACANSGLRPSTLLALTNPDSDSYHPEFSRAVQEEEHYQLLSIEDDLLIKARGGDAVSQRFVLDRRVERYKQKRPEEKAHVVWNLEALSDAADTLLSLSRRARRGEEEEAEAEAPREVPISPEGPSEDPN